MFVWVKGLASVLLGLFAVVCILAGLALSAMLFDIRQAKLNRANLRDFRQAEKFVLAYRAEKGHLPDPADLETWVASVPLETNLILNIHRTPVHYCNDKDDPFETAPNDQFVLFDWRGVFTDCYASPSRKTTLEISEDYWLKYNIRTTGPFAVGALLFGAALAYLAFRLWPRRRNLVDSYAASSS
jgi:type II secretory pathway pseudopilin PulG